ncbi:lipid A export permease/ATP-binding protein MsbA [Desulforhabdus amnigena]|uniref:ABC transporter ATP-binding protein n=1 Tax=Desulforhabdus amnigena TaxID=40218 RepID=A0A9W6CUD8_9BACT|nr:lipid A export permease/ATP-binding protein MsbA [Desulforhabdus amnigena]GLI32639.1 ABC transporter ATP-binding protein [Desulforhabdus amnigena]
MKIYKRMFQYVKPHWRRLSIAMICMTGTAASTAASAYLIKPVLDDIFMNKRMDMLKILSLVVLLMFILKGVCAWGNSYLMNHVGQRIIARLRQQLYDHIQSLSLSFFDKTPTGVLMSRITNDVTQIQGAVSDAITGLLKDSFSIVGLLAVVFYRDWKLASMAVLILPLAFYPIVKFGKMLRRISTKSQQSIGDLSVILHETFSGARIVKAFGMEEYEKARFAGENLKFMDYTMKSVAVRALSSPVMEFLGGLGIVFIIWYGGYNVIMGVSTPGNFFSFMAALLMLYEPVKRLSNTNNTLQQGVAAGYRVFDILDTQPDIQDKPGAVVLPPIKRGIALKGVHFRYGDEPVLTDINLEVPAGKIVALVGVSGSGKTTLVNLIPRFYEVTRGAVLIDGIDIRDVTIASLRSQIGIVTQQSILFNDTVRNNIAYGSIEKSETEIMAAARAANAYDFIMKMPKGFDTLIGEQGMLLSGGERQRICIARALLKNAPILILDEATSSLDSESELEVQKALENLMEGRTTLVIAHRLSTIKNADLIVALANGRILEKGRHEDLLRENGEYRRLYELQFSQMESPAALVSPPGVAAGHGR